MREDITGRRESANTISVGPRWVGEREHEYYGEYRITTDETYIIMRTIWLRMHIAMHFDLQILYHYAYNLVTP